METAVKRSNKTIPNPRSLVPLAVALLATALFLLSPLGSYTGVERALVNGEFVFRTLSLSAPEPFLWSSEESTTVFSKWVADAATFCFYAFGSHFFASGERGIGLLYSFLALTGFIGLLSLIGEEGGQIRESKGANERKGNSESERTKHGVRATDLFLLIGVAFLFSGVPKRGDELWSFSVLPFLIRDLLACGRGEIRRREWWVIPLCVGVVAHTTALAPLLPILAGGIALGVWLDWRGREEQASPLGGVWGVLLTTASVLVLAVLSPTVREQGALWQAALQAPEFTAHLGEVAIGSVDFHQAPLYRFVLPLLLLAGAVIGKPVRWSILLPLALALAGVLLTGECTTVLFVLMPALLVPVLTPSLITAPPLKEPAPAPPPPTDRSEASGQEQPAAVAADTGADRPEYTAELREEDTEPGDEPGGALPSAPQLFGGAAAYLALFFINPAIHHPTLETRVRHLPLASVHGARMLTTIALAPLVQFEGERTFVDDRVLPSQGQGQGQGEGQEQELGQKHHGSLLRDYQELTSFGEQWFEVLERWKFDAALLPEDHSLVTVLRTLGWVVVARSPEKGEWHRGTLRFTSLVLLSRSPSRFAPAG